MVEEELVASIFMLEYGVGRLATNAELVDRDCRYYADVQKCSCVILSMFLKQSRSLSRGPSWDNRQER